LLLSYRRALPSQCLSASRNFSQTPLVLKKGGKAAKQEARSSGTEEQAEDPHDFSPLEAGIQKALERLQEELSKLRTGGRFNPELLESIRVQLKKDNKLTIRLGDLAQVVPKGGKSVVVLVGEADVSWMFSRSLMIFI
jgi:ribosome recycling factor